MDRARTQRGLALIMVLWSMVLLALLAGSVLHRSTADLRLARNLADGAQAELAADAGVRLAIAELAADTGWPAPGEPRRLRLQGAEIAVRVSDETGRIDLNAAAPELLRALLEVLGAGPGQAAALADAIADFRDADGERRALGAEDADYAAAGMALGARDGPFATAAELGRVPGMPPGLRQALLEHVTVHSGLAEPVAAAAGPAVRAALARLAEWREAAGAGGAGGAGARTDGALGMVTGGAPPRRRMLARIEAEAETAQGAGFVRQAVVEVSPDAPPHYRILDWQRRWRPGP